MWVEMLKTLFQVESHRLHLWVTELAYRDDTFFSEEEIEEGIDEDMYSLQHTFEKLRFGDPEHHLPGNDNLDYAHAFYYDAPCPSAHRNESLSVFDYLNCQTLTRKVRNRVS